MSDAPAPDVKITEGAKAVMNDPALVATAEKVLKAAFGDKLRTSPPGTPSEDFSEFVNAGVPSMMFNIGVYEPEKWLAANKAGEPLAGNHSPQFAPVPKPTIQTGIELTSPSSAPRSPCSGKMRAPAQLISGMPGHREGPRGGPTMMVSRARLREDVAYAALCRASSAWYSLNSSAAALAILGAATARLASRWAISQVRSAVSPWSRLMTVTRASGAK
jgi:hypothetical protein